MLCACTHTLYAYINTYVCTHLGLIEELLVLARNSIGSGPVAKSLAAALHEGDGTVDITTSVHHNASTEGIDEIRVVELGLHQLQGDVLSALELDEVLFAVNNHEAAIKSPLSNITSGEVASAHVCLPGLLGLPVVSISHHVAANPHLSTSLARLTLDIDGVRGLHTCIDVCMYACMRTLVVPCNAWSAHKYSCMRTCFYFTYIQIKKQKVHKLYLYIYIYIYIHIFTHTHTYTHTQKDTHLVRHTLGIAEGAAAILGHAIYQPETNSI
jgi:hypothetical protein